MDTLIRDIRLTTVQNRPTLVSTPAENLQRLERQKAAVGPQRITTDGIQNLQGPEGGAYRLELTIERDDPRDQPEARLHLESGGATFATVGYNFQDETVFLRREQPTDGDLGELFTQPRTAA